MSGTIIIGAGQAGSAAAAKLRNLGYEGDITLIGAETAPPLSTPAAVQEIYAGRNGLRASLFAPD